MLSTDNLLRQHLFGWWFKAGHQCSLLKELAELPTRERCLRLKALRDEGQDIFLMAHDLAAQSSALAGEIVARFPSVSPQALLDFAVVMKAETFRLPEQPDADRVQAGHETARTLVDAMKAACKPAIPAAPLEGESSAAAMATTTTRHKGRVAGVNKVEEAITQLRARLDYGESTSIPVIAAAVGYHDKGRTLRRSKRFMDYHRGMIHETKRLPNYEGSKTDGKTEAWAAGSLRKSKGSCDPRDFEKGYSYPPDDTEDGNDEGVN